MASFWFRFWRKSWQAASRTTVRRARRPECQRLQLLLESLEERALLSTYTVTNTNDGGDGSLRAGIFYADANDGTLIRFNIPGHGVHTIRPTSPLPALLAPTVIDGSTQPDYDPLHGPVIALDGSAAGQVGGLTIFTSHCSVTALTVSNFPAYGIGIINSAFNRLQYNFIYGNHHAKGFGNLGSGVYIVGGQAQFNVLLSNYIGGDPTGQAVGNDVGVTVAGGAAYNTIGGEDDVQSNEISGNRLTGVRLQDGASWNVVQGNYIGVHAPNGNDGVLIFDGAHDNVVGSTTHDAFRFNSISGNHGYGVHIYGSGTTQNLVRNSLIGNVIGPDDTPYPLPNAQGGVRIEGGASENTIGGQFEASGNFISGNAEPGGVVSGVAISDSGTSYNVVQGNWIGLDHRGRAMANDEGVSVYGASFNTIGGTAPGVGNVISGNNYRGVVLDGVGTNHSVVQGNLIGTDPNGTHAVPNGTFGVWLSDGASINTIGGTASGAGNLISGNGSSGVWIADGSTRNTLQGNYIGTNAAATTALPNQGNGVVIEAGASANVIGGTQAGAGNIIAGNSGEGVVLAGGATANLLQGNAIGTDASGTLKLGNAFNGVAVYGANNLIGGNDAGAGNRIMNNGVDGVRIVGGAGNTVWANTINHNSATGVTIYIRASGNHVWDNEIVANGGIGVRIGEGPGDTTTIRNDLRRNAISLNGALGIDLAGDGVTPNHTGFMPGPNNFQNYPEKLDASSDTSTTTVNGSLLNQDPAAANKDFTLEFFVNAVGDPSGFGQGEKFLRAQFSLDGSATVNPDGSATVHTDADGNASFTNLVLDGTTPGQFLTATATDRDGNTSEFSAWVAITDAGSGPAAAGRIAAWVLGQRAAMQSAPAMALPQSERFVTEGPLPPADSVPFQRERPGPAAVEAFFGGTWFRSQRELRHETAAVLSMEDAPFFGAGVWALYDW